MSKKSIWDQLGIAPTRDQQAIRNAYAKKLRQANPEDDPVAFQALRSAYETAIRWLAIPSGEPGRSPARIGRDARAGWAAAANDPRRMAASPAFSPGEGEVRAMAFIAELRQTLRISSCVTPAQIEALDGILQDVVHGPVALRVEFEASLADVILAHVPDTDVVTRKAAHQLDWASYHGRIGANDRLLTAAAHFQGLILLDQLRAGTHRLSSAYEVLAKPPTRWRLRARVLMTDLQVRVRELLTLLRGEYPTIEAYLDTRTVSWWDNYYGRARVKFRWVLLTPPLGLICGYVLTLQTRVLDDLAHPLLRVIFLGTLAAVTIWQAIRYTAEWAPILVTQVQSRFARSMIHIGWFPTSLLLVLTMGVCQSQALIRSFLVLSAVGCVGWAIAMRETAHQPSYWRRPLVYLVVVSSPLVVWLMLLGESIPTDLLLTLSCAIVAQLLGFASLFQGHWLKIPAAARRSRLIALLLCAAAALAFLLASSGHRDLNQLTAAVVVVTVLLHRVPAVSLSGMQWFALISVMAAAIGPIAFAFDRFERKQLELTGGGVWLVGGVVLALVMVFSSETGHSQVRPGTEPG